MECLLEGNVNPQKIGKELRQGTISLAVKSCSDVPSSAFCNASSLKPKFKLE